MSAKTNIAELKRTGDMKASAAGMGSVRKYFEASKGAMTAVLPAHVKPERMLALAFGAMRQNPKLMEATTESLMSAVIVSSQLGLEPNTPLGHAYLIPFQRSTKDANGQWSKVTEVQFIPGYKGLIDLARRSGQIVSIAAHAVHENDDFSYEYGLEEKLRHKPTLGHRGEVTAFYSVAKLTGGGHFFEVMGVDQVREIRDQSQGYQAALVAAKKYKKTANHPWIQHFGEMGRKTLIRRAFKYLPISIEMASAVRLDEQTEEGRGQNLESALDGDFVVMDGEELDTETGEITDQSTAEPEQAQEQAPPPAQEKPQAQETKPKGIDPNVILNGIETSKTAEDLADCEDMGRDIDRRTAAGKAIDKALADKRAELGL